MRGCMAKDENGNYLLVSSRGVKVKLNNSDDIAKHVGQQVRVSGAFIDAVESPNTTPGSTGNPANSNAAAKHHAAREFRVVKVDVIAQTCSAPAAKKK